MKNKEQAEILKDEPCCAETNKEELLETDAQNESEEKYSDDENSEELTDEEKEEEKRYLAAVEDFAKRLIVVEMLDANMEGFSKYTKSIQGISCTLGITNAENLTVSPLHDEFDSPFDYVSTWAIAVRNCVALSKVDEETSMSDINTYVISSACGRSIICCDEFFDSICEKYGVMRLLINLYYSPEDNNPLVCASLIKDNQELITKSVLRNANKNDQYRTSLVYVKGIGALSEAALNSEI